MGCLLSPLAGDRRSAASTAGSYPAGVPHADVHREAAFPLGAAATLEELEADPHPRQARLREREPVSWLPALGAWLVTRRDLVLHVMRDAETYTVDHPRFSTAQVVGPSMLSLDGDEHARHRDPFARAVPARRGARALRRRSSRTRPRGCSRRSRRPGRRRCAGRWPGRSPSPRWRARWASAPPTRRPSLGWYDASSAPSTGVSAGAAGDAGRARGVRRPRARPSRGSSRRGPGDSMLAAAARGRARRRRRGLERRRAAVRRHRDDRGHDRQPRLARARRRRRSSPRCAPSRRCWRTPSRSRCAWSPRPPSSTASRRAT